MLYSRYEKDEKGNTVRKSDKKIVEQEAPKKSESKKEEKKESKKPAKKKAE